MGTRRRRKRRRWGGGGEEDGERGERRKSSKKLLTLKAGEASCNGAVDAGCVGRPTCQQL